MSFSPQIIFRREQKKIRRRQNPARWLGLGCSTIVSLAALFGCVASAALYAYLTNNLPSIGILPILLDAPEGFYLQPTRIYDRTDQNLLVTLETPSAAGHQYLTYDAEHVNAGLPEVLVQATLLVNDPNFWTHPGYQWESLLRGDHPTLAQRLVYQFILRDEQPGWRRNIREILLAAQVTTQFGKPKVLEWYLNHLQYGDFIYGADAAARAFFGKPVTQLDIAETAALVAIAETPALPPAKTADRVLQRQREILQEMVIHSAISPEEALAASQETITFAEPAAPEDPAPAFTNLLLDQLASQIPIENILRGGFHIISTMDYDLQQQAECASQIQIDRLTISNSGSPGKNDQTCLAGRLLPTLTLENQAASPDLAAAVIVINPHSGEILTIVGSSIPGLDPANHPGHIGGTILTPFIYLTGFSRGLSPGSLMWDIPESQSPGPSADELPGLEDNLAYHGPLRLRTAFVNDYLNPANSVIEQVGTDNVWRTARSFGLALPAGNSATSGSSSRFAFLQNEVTLLELVKAFGILDTQGLLTGQVLSKIPVSGEAPSPTPVTVRLVKDRQGNPLLDWSLPHSQPIVSAQLAYLVTHILSDETARWPSLGHPNPLEIGRPSATKIGKSLDGQNTWAIGYLPQLAAGVWIGTEEKSQVQVNPLAAAALWHAIVQYADQDLPARDWEIPPGISQVDVCDPSGMLPTSYCPTVVSEVFINGNEPTQRDNLYRAFQINRETGRLATAFTPPELVEERVFLVTPPEAETWAEQAGLPTPPKDYDVIFAPLAGSPEAQIAAPAMFAYVNGQVKITGSAGGKDFKFYRLQVGQGLNPQEWIQLGGDSEKPVQNGTLAVWDTQGLDGLYAIQLLVVRNDQRVETNIVQVSIDNTPPDVQILNPSPGEILRKKAGTPVVLQASVEDDFVVDTVIFSIDGQQLASLSQAPMNIAWIPKPGSHQLSVAATDLAGNRREVSIQFQVVEP